MAVAGQGDAAQVGWLSVATLAPTRPSLPCSSDYVFDRGRPAKVPTDWIDRNAISLIFPRVSPFYGVEFVEPLLDQSHSTTFTDYLRPSVNR